jgi:hypothetical protein
MNEAAHADELPLSTLTRAESAERVPRRLVWMVRTYVQQPTWKSQNEHPTAPTTGYAVPANWGMDGIEANLMRFEMQIVQ